MAELLPENGGSAVGMVELDIIYGNASQPGAQIFQAYGHFKHLAGNVPYQWLILKSGLKVLDTEPIVVTSKNVLGEFVVSCWQKGTEVRIFSSTRRSEKIYRVAEQNWKFWHSLYKNQ